VISPQKLDSSEVRGEEWSESVGLTSVQKEPLRKLSLLLDIDRQEELDVSGPRNVLVGP
jgi:hypothetical protein